MQSIFIIFQEICCIILTTKESFYTDIVCCDSFIMPLSALLSNFTGGGATHRLIKNVCWCQKHKDKKSDVLRHVILPLGQEIVNSLKESWDSLRTSNHGRGGHGDLVDGILMSL